MNKVDVKSGPSPAPPILHGFLYPGVPLAIGQDMRYILSQHFSVTEGLKATNDC